MPGRILIVDDVATNRVILRVKLSAARYHVLEAADGIEALEIARREKPDLILMDLSMPGMDGLEVCRNLKETPECAKIPVVIFSAYRETRIKLRALEAGAEEFMSKPFDEIALMARIRSLLRARHIAQELSLRDGTSRALGLAEAGADGLDVPGSIALVAGENQESDAWRKLLQPLVHHKVKTMSIEEALSGDTGADLYMIACDMSGSGDGLQLIPELRAREETRHSAIVVQLGENSRSQAAMALDLGASDILAAPLDPEEMALRLSTHLRRKHDADRLRRKVADGLQMAVTDPLTGLYNRRYAMSHLARVREHARREGRSFAVMMLDLDNFKLVNDTHGHAAGDLVLRSVAERIASNLRGVDLLARIGGEEFLAVLPDCSAEDAARAAERLRATVEATPVPLGRNVEGKHLLVKQTVSIGVVAVGPYGDKDAPLMICRSEDALLEQADRALYRAKLSGRNSVTVGQMAA